MQKKVILLYLFFYLVTLNPSFSKEKIDFIAMKQTADSLFVTQKYTDAKVIYNSLYSQSYLSHDMLLKLAYIHEGLDETQFALFYLEKYILQFGPDQDVLDHISEIASKQNLTGYGRNDYNFMRSWLIAWRNYISIALISLILFWVALLFFRKKKSLSLPILILSMVSLCILQGLKNPSKKVIISDTAFLRDAPSSAGNVVKKIASGHKLKLLGAQDVWLQVIYNGETCYIKKNQVLML